MGNLRSEREKKLQRKLIPINILVCIVCLVASISLFMTPLVQVDFGKILGDDAVVELADNMVDSALDGLTDDSDIDLAPVAHMLTHRVLKGVNGKVAVSAVSSFKVLVAGDEMEQKALDELLFNDKAVVTNLIVSLVDGLVGVFTTPEGKALLEEAVISVLSRIAVKDAEDKGLTGSVEQNVNDLIDIIKELGDSDKVEGGRVDGIAGRFLDKIESLLSDGETISVEDRENFINRVQDMYDDTIVRLEEGESVSIEALFCVAVSNVMDLSKIDIVELIKKFIPSFNSGEAARFSIVDDLLEGGEGDDERPIVTNYDDLLDEIGLGEDSKEDLKVNLGSALKDEIVKLLDKAGVTKYLKLYGLISIVVIIAIVPWIILFLFAFIHMFTGNKRFLTWYVLLVGWIPGAIWVVAKLIPLVVEKIVPKIPQLSKITEIWNSDVGGLIQAVLHGISSFVWVSGLCYILLLIFAICALPIKRKIRRERNYPEVKDAHDDYDEDGDYDDYDDENYKF